MRLSGISPFVEIGEELRTHVPSGTGTLPGSAQPQGHRGFARARGRPRPHNPCTACPPYGATQEHAALTLPGVFAKSTGDGDTSLLHHALLTMGRLGRRRTIAALGVHVDDQLAEVAALQ